MRVIELRNYLLKDGATGDYPRLPVIQDATPLVVLSAYRDREHYAIMRTEWSHSDVRCTGLQGDMRALLAADAETIRLRPTAKSLIRYQSKGLQ